MKSPERYSTKAVIGIPFDALMARVVRLQPQKPKKGSKPSTKDAKNKLAR